MSSFKITDGVYAVGALNPNMRVFDVVMRTEYGTSYNSYIVKGADKTALIECCHLRFFDRFVENISLVTDISKIDYIVLNHCEPDHSGCLARLQKLAPNAKIIVSRAGSIYLKNITNDESLPIEIAFDGGTIDLGGKTLRFVSAPFLHWPDSMFTYVAEDKIAFTCDFLGSHYCEPYMIDSEIAYPERYKTALKVYFDAIFGPFKKYVKQGLQKFAELNVKYCCCSHGPILTSGCMLENAVEKYTEWSAETSVERPLIPVFYASAYGNTAKIAKSIAEGIGDVRGDANIELFDLVDADLALLASKLNSSAAFAIGSPTINADAVPLVWQLLACADAINIKKRPALVFGSFGWSGEAVPNITERLRGLKVLPYGDGLKVCFVPTQEDIAAARQLGSDFARTL